MTIRGYFVHEAEVEYGVVVVAISLKEAKRIGWNELSVECDEYIYLRVRWIKDADVSGLPLGIVTDIADGLRRGLYAWSEDVECDVCGVSTHVYGEEGVVICGACQNECFLEYHREALRRSNNDTP